MSLPEKCDGLTDRRTNGRVSSKTSHPQLAALATNKQTKLVMGTVCVKTMTRVQPISMSFIEHCCQYVLQMSVVQTRFSIDTNAFNT